MHFRPVEARVLAHLHIGKIRNRAVLWEERERDEGNNDKTCIVTHSVRDSAELDFTWHYITSSNHNSDAR